MGAPVHQAVYAQMVLAVPPLGLYTGGAVLVGVVGFIHRRSCAGRGGRSGGAAAAGFQGGRGAAAGRECQGCRAGATR